MKPPEPSDKLRLLAEAAIDHAADSIEEGGPLVPFVFVLRGADVEAFRCLVGTEDSWDLGESVAQAKNLAREHLGKSDGVAAAFDGYITSDKGVRRDCIFIEAIERGVRWVYTFGQAYRPADAPQGFILINDPFIADARKTVG